tara:strand:- start:322 stop:645 length:324 start_codon:yes stop_codon:yes gene_type:complete
MKFALIALVAAVTAVKVHDYIPITCIKMKVSDPLFDEIDTSKDGKVSKKELTAAYLKKQKEYGSSPEIEKKIAEFKAAAKTAAGEDELLTKGEFNDVCNMLAHDLYP